MRLVIQRVARASVSVDGQQVSAIGPGLMSERQKEARKEFIDATKELFGNHDERKASVHFAKLIGILLSNH